MEDADIPKRVILVLVVLTIVISVLGTWTVMDAVSRSSTYEPKSVAKGTVSLKINMPPGSEPPQQTQDNGMVSIKILENKGG
ncbi:MAG: hypothetical protein ABIG95_04495 [Candidatus Woesearchaeota archaeon]